MPTTSPKFSLDLRDAAKGFLMAILSPLLVVLANWSTGHFDINWTEQWHIAVSAGAAYLLKNFFSGKTPPKSGQINSMGFKTMAVLLALLTLSSICKAQSPFKALPRIKSASLGFAKVLSQKDSFLHAWRFEANIAAYSEPGNIAMAGIGYGFQSLKWNYNTSKWYCRWSISGVGFAGGSVAPSTPASIMSLGLLGGFVDNLLMAGPVYNFGTKQFGIAISAGINLNN